MWIGHRVLKGQTCSLGHWMLSTYYWSLEKDLYKFHEGNGYVTVENKIAIWCLISISVMFYPWPMVVAIISVRVCPGLASEVTWEKLRFWTIVQSFLRNEESAHLNCFTCIALQNNLHIVKSEMLFEWKLKTIIPSVLSSHFMKLNLILSSSFGFTAKVDLRDSWYFLK